MRVMEHSIPSLQPVATFWRAARPSYWEYKEWAGDMESFALSHTVSEGRNWSFHPGAALSAPLWGVNIIYTVYSAIFLSLGAASTAHLTLSKFVSQVFLETFHSVSAQWNDIVPPGSHLFSQRVVSPVGVLSSYNGALWSPWVQFGCTLPIFTAC